MPNAHLEEIEDDLLKPTNIKKTTPAMMILVTMQCLPDDGHVPDTLLMKMMVMSQELHQMKMSMSHENTEHLAEACR